MNSSSHDYVPLLRYHQLSFLYDALLFISGLGTHFKRKITERAGLAKTLTGTIVDVGCGTGVHARILADHFKSAHINGLDLDATTLAQVRKKTARYNLDFIVGSATKLPFNEATISVIFSTLTLHHLTNEHKQVAFREAYRVLEPGGHLILTDWGISRVTWMRYFLLFENQTLLNDHFQGLIPQYAKSAGFKERSAVRVKPTGIWQWHFRK